MRSTFPLRLAAVAAAAALGSAPAVQAVSVSEAAVLANACGGCHGTDGASIGEMPSIKGKKKAFIRQSLLDFRDGKKEATVMNRIAKGYSDKQIELLAEYFSAQK